MVSWVYNKNTGRYDIYGLSSDTKPLTYGDLRDTVVPNGTLFLEMDTSNFYAFDETASEWLPL